MATVPVDDDNVPSTQRLDVTPVPGIPTMHDVEDEAEASDSKPDNDWRELIDLRHVKDDEFRKKIMSTLENYAPLFE